MENTIDYGIDLGTTNSVIARFVKGEVEVLKSPVSWMETTPSVVSFRKNKIQVGAKAKEYLEKAPENVVGGFKRKMGTTETFRINEIDRSVSPIELSAHVIKELKTYNRGSEVPDATIITIPACFDMIQSNATEEAGYQAGFQYVELLQEPIAASLACANLYRDKELTEGCWLVYDLGGGTFDVALVKIHGGEMKILDHEGNNYLGGKDFDHLIVEKIIVPYLEEHYDFTDLLTEMTSASGSHNRDYYNILGLSEKAKIQLSSSTAADIDFEITDNVGEEQDVLIPISRSDFESLIREKVDETIELIRKLLVRNSLTPRDLKFVLMVGGSTFIPLVQKRAKELLQVPINIRMDPTTIVAIGAAYYAGSRVKKVKEQKVKKTDKSIDIKFAYSKTTTEQEELLAAKVKGNVEGLYYKIIRKDGGFDSGTKVLTSRISEDLPLVKNSYNIFTFTIYDEKGNQVDADIEMIGIAQGGVVFDGQPIPYDISLEIDDLANKTTENLLLFQKNSILPLRKKVQLPLNKNIPKGTEEKFIVNVMQGDHRYRPETNKTIGYMEISGKQLAYDAVKGSEVEITVEMSESCDLTVSAYVKMTKQEFKQVFIPKKRHITVEYIQEQIENMLENLEKELIEAEEREDYTLASKLNKAKNELEKVEEEVCERCEDDVTDRKFQLEDDKRKIAQEIESVTKERSFIRVRSEYFEVKKRCHEIVESDGNDREKRHFQEIINRENEFIGSQNISMTRKNMEALMGLFYTIRWRIPVIQESLFESLKQDSHKLNDPEQVKILIETGETSLENKNYERLSEVNSRLIDLLPENERETYRRTGLSEF